MILVKNMVIKNPTIINKFAKGNTYTSYPSFKYYYRVSDDSGSICRTATLINSAPANVDPIILNLGLVLNAFERIGKVPTKQTMRKNSIMNTILRIGV